MHTDSDNLSPRDASSRKSYSLDYVMRSSDVDDVLLWRSILASSPEENAVLAVRTVSKETLTVD